MKVISKPKLPIQKCAGCNSLVKVKYRNLKTDGCSLRKIRWDCPVCKAVNLVSFEYYVPPFASATIEDIKRVSAEIVAKNFNKKQVEEMYGWKIGDMATLKLGENEQLYEIIDFNFYDEVYKERKGILLASKFVKFGFSVGNTEQGENK